eukprot:Rmarinus@m.22674
MPEVEKWSPHTSPHKRGRQKGHRSQSYYAKLEAARELYRPTRKVTGKADEKTHGVVREIIEEERKKRNMARLDEIKSRVDNILGEIDLDAYADNAEMMEDIDTVPEAVFVTLGNNFGGSVVLSADQELQHIKSWFDRTIETGAVMEVLSDDSLGFSDADDEKDPNNIFEGVSAHAPASVRIDILQTHFNKQRLRVEAYKKKLLRVIEKQNRKISEYQQSLAASDARVLELQQVVEENAKKHAEEFGANFFGGGQSLGTSGGKGRISSMSTDQIRLEYEDLRERHNRSERDVRSLRSELQKVQKDFEVLEAERNETVSKLEGDLQAIKLLHAQEKFSRVLESTPQSPRDKDDVSIESRPRRRRHTEYQRGSKTGSEINVDVDKLDQLAEVDETSEADELESVGGEDEFVSRRDVNNMKLQLLQTFENKQRAIVADNEEMSIELEKSQAQRLALEEKVRSLMTAFRLFRQRLKKGKEGTSSKKSESPGEDDVDAATADLIAHIEMES